MNAKAAAEPIVKKIDFEGEDWLYFPAIAPQVAIIRATTADERGNLTYEHEGAYLGGLDQALAARNNGGIVIAQVKRVDQGRVAPPARCARARHAGRLHRRRSRPEADDADALRPRHLR